MRPPSQPEMLGFMMGGPIPNLLFGLAVLAAASSPPTLTDQASGLGYVAPRPARKITEILPGRLVQRLAAAQKVESFLLCDPNTHDCPARAAELDGTSWLIRSSGGPLDRRRADALKAVLLNPSTYVVFQTLGEVKTCGGLMLVGFRFTVNDEQDHSERVTVEFMPDCGALAFYGRRTTVFCDCDYGTGEILSLVRELYPDDARVQRAWDVFLKTPNSITSSRSQSSQSALGLSEPDRATVAAATIAYRDAWLTNDPAAVMATLAPDAVLLPSGTEPISGEAAIRSFWWPPDGPPTRVTAMEQVIDDITGKGDVAVVRGHGTLTFVMTLNGTDQVRSHRSTFINILHRQANGRWLITQRIWSDIQ